MTKRRFPMVDSEKQDAKFQKQAEMLRRNLILRKKQVEERQKLLEQKERQAENANKACD